MKSIEKGMQMPQDICFEKDNETKHIIKCIFKLEKYFRFLRNPKNIENDLKDEYLKILN